MKRFISHVVAILCVACSGFSNEPTAASVSTTQAPSAQAISKRCQEPLSPYPYEYEEVVFENTSAQITLAGTLTLPRSSGPFPAVILLHGSAPLDRDSSLFGHKPFLVWADHLTRQGIAVLRFDKRSAGKSTGDYSTSTIEDFAQDALAAMEYLKTRKEINAKQIGFIGFSEGGLTTVLAASQSNEAAFIVLMAAPGVNFEEIVLMQEPLLQRIDGVPEETITQSQQFRKQMVTLIKKEREPKIAEKQLRVLFSKHFSKLSLSQKKVAETYYGPIETQINLFNSTSFRYNFSYEPKAALKKIKIPILALNGDRDFIVPCDQNLTQIDKTLREIGHKDYKCMKLPKLNHMFQTCHIGSIAECEKIEETTAPLALNLVSEWILKKIE